MKKFVFAVVLAGSACYTYGPVGETLPESGAEVRAHLSPMQDFELGEITVHDVNRIDGVVFQATGDTLAVWGKWLFSILGTRYDPQGAVFSMDRATVPAVEVRRLNPFRTAVALSLGLGLGYAFFDFAADPGGEGDQGTGSGGIQFRAGVPTSVRNR